MNSQEDPSRAKLGDSSCHAAKAIESRVAKRQRRVVRSRTTAGLAVPLAVAWAKVINCSVHTRGTGYQPGNVTCQQQQSQQCIADCSTGE